MAPPQTWWKPPKAPNPGARCGHCGKPGPSERCARCRAVGYCDRDCQTKDWKQGGHKARCDELRATVAAAAGAAPLPPEDNAVRPLPASELFPYPRFLEAWRAAAPRLDAAHPLGIPNAGNTCYLGSILQCLLATRPLAAHLLAHPHAAACPRPHRHVWCPLCELGTMARQVFPPAGGARPAALDAGPFSRRAMALGREFTPHAQHDAQELFIKLLEAVEAVAAREAAGAGAPPPSDAPSARTTAFHHAFSTCDRATVDCCMCGAASRTFAVESQLMVAVPEGAAPTSLDALLREWAAPETMEGDAAYDCSSCARKVRAQRSVALEVAPNVLAVHLNRTNWTTERKNAAPVAFPAALDLGALLAFDALDAGPAGYRLYALVAHEGEALDDGHYTAWVRYGERWFECDDEEVREEGEAAALAQRSAACMLFYEREAPRPPVRSAVEDAEAVLAALEEGERAVAAEEAAAGLAALRVGPAPPASPSLSPGSSQGEGDDPLGLGYSYACRVGPTTDGRRVLRFQATLTGGRGSGSGRGGPEPELVLEDDAEGVRWLELRRGGQRVLRLPAPVAVGAAVRDAAWAAERGTFVALLDVQ